MKKIIHFSDLHVGHGDQVNVLRNMISRMIMQKTPAEKYVVVITGDVVENAFDDGSYEMASSQLDRLTKEGFTVLVVPGNHDYGNGGFANKKFVDRFKKHFFGSTEISYPKLDIVDNIAFLGLDSTAEEVGFFDRIGADGELGNDQLNRLKKILNSQKVQDCEYKVVYLHHHPFDPRGFLHHLKDTDELQDVLEGSGIDALLFGHNHDGRVWNNCWGIKRVYDAGTSTGKGGKDCKHRVIDLSLHPSTDYDGEF